MNVDRYRVNQQSPDDQEDHLVKTEVREWHHLHGERHTDRSAHWARDTSVGGQCLGNLPGEAQLIPKDRGRQRQQQYRPPKRGCPHPPGQRPHRRSRYPTAARTARS